MGRPRSEIVGFVAALVVLWLLTGVSETQDPDIFWHLAVGKAALAERSLLSTDPFSYSFGGQPWPYKDLVSAVLLHGLFRAFGFGAFVLVKGAAVATFAWAFLSVQPRPRSLGLAAVGVALALGSFWLVERPNLLSLVFFALLLPLLEAKERTLRVLVLLWIWALFHRFALVGVALAALSLLWHRRWLAAALAPIVVLLTPNGAALYTSSIRALLDPSALRLTTEWSRLGPLELARAFPLACVLAVAAWIVVGARRRHFLLAVPLALCTVLTLGAVRWLPYLAITSVAVLVRHAADGLVVWTSRPRGVFALALVLLASLLVWQRRNDHFRIGEHPDWAPRGALAFAAEHGLEGNVVTSIDLGGYLVFHAWPKVRVLVDSRNEILYPAAFVTDCIKAEQGDAARFAEMRADDGADWVFAANPPGEPSFGYLARDPAWSLVYWSETGAIYVRRDAHAELEPYRYHYVDPRDVEGSIVAAINSGAPPDALRAEIARMPPDAIHAQLARAIFARAIGAIRESDRILAEVLERHGDDPGVVALVTAVRGLGRGQR